METSEPRAELAIVACIMLVGTVGWLITRASEPVETMASAVLAPTAMASDATADAPLLPQGVVVASQPDKTPDVPIPRPKPG